MTGSEIVFGMLAASYLSGHDQTMRAPVRLHRRLPHLQELPTNVHFVGLMSVCGFLFLCLSFDI